MADALQSFNEMTLSSNFQKSLKSKGFEAPTSMQARVIPVALSNRDLLVSTQPGHGKITTFCIPILAKLEKNVRKAALVLVADKKSAADVLEFFSQLSPGKTEMTPTVLVGGSMPTQIKELAEKPRIIIATPSRLVEHLRRGSVSLFSIDILVINEADKLFDLGAAAQLCEILRFLPSKRQTLIFTSSLSPEIQTLASKYLKDPVRHSEGPAVEKPKKKSLIAKNLAAKSVEVTFQL